MFVFFAACTEDATKPSKVVIASGLQISQSVTDTFLLEADCHISSVRSYWKNLCKHFVRQTHYIWNVLELELNSFVRCSECDQQLVCVVAMLRYTTNDLGIFCSLQKLIRFHLKYASIQKLAHMCKVCMHSVYFTFSIWSNVESWRWICWLKMHIVNS